MTLASACFTGHVCTVLKRHYSDEAFKRQDLFVQGQLHYGQGTSHCDVFLTCPLSLSTGDPRVGLFNGSCRYGLQETFCDQSYKRQDQIVQGLLHSGPGTCLWDVLLTCSLSFLTSGACATCFMGHFSKVFKGPPCDQAYKRQDLLVQGHLHYGQGSSL